MEHKELNNKGRLAREVSKVIMLAGTDVKNKVLEDAAAGLEAAKDELIRTNRKDLDFAKDKGISGAFYDRLMLDEKRIDSMSGGLREIAALDDPVGEVVEMSRRPNGLEIGKKRVPMGVIGIIYESRPNVTADAFGLCLKTGNTTLLRGGKEAIHSNLGITAILQQALIQNDLPAEGVQLVEDTSRDSSVAMMKLDQYLDILIPRGGAGLIRAVVENSRVPVIETGVGNCHVYIDKDADAEKALQIAVNSKVQRPGVCNAAESLLIHKDIFEKMAERLAEAFQEHKVEIRGDDLVVKHFPGARAATEEDWATEYLDLVLAVRVVDSPEEAIRHISRYGTRHTEAIVTENYTTARRFVDEIDAAAVNVNASTRFTDGFEYGYGAEIGISTQKLHARGPMGLRELTTTKYVVYGDGQVRE